MRDLHATHIPSDNKAGAAHMHYSFAPMTRALHSWQPKHTY
uniref:Uncharacterized protein n=1 Tax=Anguilla anguilla TaxID=7936 RepID=A0A0E9TWB3_ANGAN